MPILKLVYEEGLIPYRVMSLAAVQHGIWCRDAMAWSLHHHVSSDG